MAAMPVDEVARQKRWEETIRKEKMIIGEPHKFFLNPNKLKFISRKPTDVDPRKYEEASLQLEEQFRQMQERSSVGGGQGERRRGEEGWACQSQEWGSFYEESSLVDPLSSVRSCWRKPRSRCDVTEYADRYCEMARVSPYARKGTDPGAKP